MTPQTSPYSDYSRGGNTTWTCAPHSDSKLQHSSCRGLPRPSPTSTIATGMFPGHTWTIFGGAEGTRERAQAALDTLQHIMGQLGLVEATKKVFRPAQTMVWLGILFDSNDMTMRIPDNKMGEIREVLEEWADRQRATQRDMQQLLGLLQLVASVSPPARIFTNRMLENLREAPRRGTESLFLGFKQDLQFFRELWPAYNGVRIIIKDHVQCQDLLELEACTTGCGAYNGTKFYSEQFPETIIQEQHPIAHLELLNIVVAAKNLSSRVGTPQGSRPLRQHERLLGSAVRPVKRPLDTGVCQGTLHSEYNTRHRVACHSQTRDHHAQSGCALPCAIRAHLCQKGG